jgi:hypothetical protein
VVVILAMLAILLPAATAPATKPAAMEMLDGGRVRFAPPPAPWRFVGKSPGDMVAVYRTDDEVGEMTITVTPQPDAVRPEHAKQMALKIGAGIRTYAKTNGVELLYGPRVQRDERFLLTVRDRMRLIDGTTHDRLQIYRMIEMEMVSIAVVARTDSQEQAKAIHAAAQELLDKARGGRGPTLSAFPKTGIRVFPPAEWAEKKVDDANGIVATYAEPNGGPARIVVRSRVVPKKIRGKDAASVAQRDALIDDMLAASGVGTDAERLPDEKKRFVRVVRKPAGADRDAHTEARYVMLGDTLIGVTITGPPERAEHLSALVDRMTVAMQRIPGR